MKEFISIKNLGPIKNVVIEDIKPITVLIGESGSGKSTLMKAIALFRWLYKMQNIRSYLKHSQLSKTPFRFRIETYLKNCGFNQFIQASTEIIYRVSFENGNDYTMAYSGQKLTGASGQDLIQSSDLSFNKISFISETRNVIPLWADKGASFTGGYLGFYFHEVYKDFDIASDTVRELAVPYLGLKLGTKKTTAGKQYSIQGDKRDYSIDLKNSSSGTQNAVPVTLIAEHFSKHFNFEEAFNRSVLNYLASADKLTDFKPVKNLGELEKNLFIHIEEPELSLYPDAQCELINDLIAKCFASNVNKIALIFSTHSPYIINNLNLLVKAADAKTTIRGASIPFEDLAVYQVTGGVIEDLLVKNERLVNTNPLSDKINEIYDQYATL